jgi:hypothetical protein
MRVMQAPAAVVLVPRKRDLPRDTLPPLERSWHACAVSCPVLSCCSESFYGDFSDCWLSIGAWVALAAEAEGGQWLADVAVVLPKESRGRVF